MKRGMAHTFQVSDLQVDGFMQRNPPARRPWLDVWLKPRRSRDEQPFMGEGRTLHASTAEIVGGPSPLFHAVGLAFNSHCPLVLTPDSVWLTCLLGLSHHIDTNPEAMRHHFVTHEGKKTLTVTVDAASVDTVTPEQWEYGIAGFSSQLGEAMVDKRRDLIVSRFSTTTEVDRLASEVVLMGAMREWFDYRMLLLCGFSRVTVEGTPEDWEDIIRRVEVLSEFDLSWWTTHLLPVLAEFKAAASGNPNVDFWQRGYLTQRVGSGGQYDVSGWITALYPYIGAAGGKMQRNPCVAWETSDGKRGLNPEDFPLGLAKAPVTVVQGDIETPCAFYGGLVGVSMAEDFTVRAESGYAIRTQP
jgi:hypothetical protein